MNKQPPTPENLLAKIPVITDADRQRLWADRTHACFFTGHRRIAAADLTRLNDALDRELEMLVWQGFDTFLCGAAMGFDLMAAAAVKRLKNIQPHVRLVYLIPCRNQDAKWNERNRRLYRAALAHGEILLLSENYTDGCMQARNRMLVDNAAMGLTYYNPRVTVSGTGMTVRYAEKQNRPMVSLYGLLYPDAPKPSHDDEQLSLFDMSEIDWED